MSLQRSGDKRSSERNVALLQIQMEAQTRNRLWYEFLCVKRDELHARLRQQGYSRRPQAGKQAGKKRADDSRQTVGPLPDGAAESAESSNRWIAAPRNTAHASPTDTDTGQAPEQASEQAPKVAAPGIDVPIWWGERDESPL
jgi:hypothetical protein